MQNLIQDLIGPLSFSAHFSDALSLARFRAQIGQASEAQTHLLSARAPQSAGAEAPPCASMEALIALETASSGVAAALKSTPTAPSL